MNTTFHPYRAPGRGERWCRPTYWRMSRKSQGGSACQPVVSRSWLDEARRDEPRELLAPVYGWFTEGFDTRDLNEAKVVLDVLA
jgi:hypothetical protein